MRAEMVQMSWKAAIILPVIWADNATLHGGTAKRWEALEFKGSPAQ